MRWRVKSFAAVLLVVLLPACENAVSISGTITLPPEVQQLFSAEQPGKIELWGTKIGKGAALPYLCAATDRTLVLGYQFTSFGCKAEQEIQARAFHVTPDHLDEVRCGERATNSASGLAGEEVAYGATMIFKGHTGSPCDSGTAVADVTLAPVN